MFDIYEDLRFAPRAEYLEVFRFGLRPDDLLRLVPAHGTHEMPVLDP